MSAISKNLKQNLLILLGLVLVLVGVSGVIVDQLTPVSESSFGMYVGPMKPLVQTAPELPTPISVVSDTPGPSPTISLPTPESRIDEGAPKSFSVQTGQNLAIENPAIPDRIVIPSIQLDAPVVQEDYWTLMLEGETFGQWQAPSMFASGWNPNSALLGKRGNTVINGHHNEFGEVFGRLVDVKVGDEVYVYSRGQKYTFVIANRMILQERFQPLEVRLENARWINATDDVRLTLITCWPKETNTHRLILVARPVANP
jgi:sortase A